MERNKLFLILIIVVFVGICSLSVSYAALQSVLEIDGSVSIEPSALVYIKSIKNVVTMNGATESFNATYDGMHLTVSDTLPNVNSYVSYYVEIYNNATTPYIFDSESILSSNNDNCTFETYGLQQNYVIGAKSSAFVEIKVKYKSSVTSVPENTTAGFVILFNSHSSGTANPTPVYNIRNYGIAYQFTTSGVGLYVNSSDVLLYRGSTPTNYVKINGDGYQVISIDPTGFMKVARTGSFIGPIEYDTTTNRTPSIDTFCSKATTSGCNPWTSYDTITASTYTGTVTSDCSLNKYLNTTWYNSQSTAFQNAMLTTSYNVGMIDQSATIDTARVDETSKVWSGKVGTFTAMNAFDAGLTLTTVNSSNAGGSWIVLLSNSTHAIWTMSMDNLDNWDVYTLYSGSKIGQRRASRQSQNAVYFYTMPVVALDSSKVSTGTGTSADPFILTYS